MRRRYRIQTSGVSNHLRFRYNGKQHGISTRCGNRREAEKIALELKEEWFEKHVIKDVIDANNLSLSKAIELYIQAKEARWKEQNKTVVKRLLGGLKDVFEEDALLGEITPILFQQYLSALQGKASPKYWTNKLFTYRSFFKWCIRTDYIHKDPTIGIETPKKHQFGRREKKALLDRRGIGKNSNRIAQRV